MTTLMVFAQPTAFSSPRWTARTILDAARAWWTAFAAAAPSHSEVNDEILARARAGDAQAFTVVVRHYDERLRALAFRLLGDRDLMDDALQDAYIKAFRGLPKFAGKSSLGTWLYRVVYNTCLDQLRAARAVVSLDAAREMENTGPAPDDVAADRGDLASALAALPPDHRAAVMLVDVDGFDYAEAGEILGVPSGTVASRLSRARAALRASLEVAQ